jgi:hypothetical protein
VLTDHTFDLHHTSSDGLSFYSHDSQLYDDDAAATEA